VEVEDVLEVLVAASAEEVVEDDFDEDLVEPFLSSFSPFFLSFLPWSFFLESLSDLLDEVAAVLVAVLDSPESSSMSSQSAEESSSSSEDVEVLVAVSDVVELVSEDVLEDVVEVDVPVPTLFTSTPDQTGWYASSISSAVTSGTNKFCVKIHPIGSSATSQVFPFAVGSPMVPGANVPLLIAS